MIFTATNFAKKNTLNVLLIIVLSVLILSCQSIPPKKTSQAQPKNCSPAQTIPPGWLHQSSPPIDNHYTATGFDPNLNQAKKNAIGNLSQTIRVNVTKRVESKQTVVAQQSQQAVTNYQKIESDIQLQHIEQQTYQDKKCQWHVLTKVSKDVINGIFNHEIAEEYYQKATNTKQLEQQRLSQINTAIELNQSIKVKLVGINLPVALKKYQQLQQQLSNTLSQVRNIGLILLDDSIKNRIYLKEKHLSLLLETLLKERIPNLYLPVQSFCTQLTDCIKQAERLSGHNLYLIRIDKIEFAAKSLGIRKAFLELSLLKHNIPKKKNIQTITSLTDWTLTQRKQDTDWNLIIQRINQRNKPAIDQIINLE